MIQASDGFLYGTSPGGRSPNGDGALFRLDLQGTESVVHSFAEFRGDGLAPARRTARSLRRAHLRHDAGRGTVRRRLASSASTLSVVIPVLTVSPASGSAADASTLVTVTGARVPGWSRGVDGQSPRRSLDDRADGAFRVQPADGGRNARSRCGAQSRWIRGVARQGLLRRLPRRAAGQHFPRGRREDPARRRSRRDAATGNYCGANRHHPLADGDLPSQGFPGRRLRPRRAPAPSSPTFRRRPFAAAWIEDLAARGITAGCGGGDYCPDAPVTRAQMAVFLLKTLLGTGYVPPDPTGTVFGDVPVDAFAAAWIEDLAGARNHRRLPGLAAALLPRRRRTRGRRWRRFW